MKKKIIIILSLIFINCDNFVKKEDFTIDLTVVFRDRVNSYKIEKNRKVFVLFNKIDFPGKMYETEFTKSEYDSLQIKLKCITLVKCDSLINHISDGLRYTIKLNNKKETIHLSGNLCDNYKDLDKLVISIVKKIDKKKKKEFYTTYNQMIPIDSQIK